MEPHKIVSKAEWVEASKTLLKEEKAWTHARDRLAEMRRALPWVKVDKAYIFQTETGPKLLADLFDGRSQLVIYHFMFGPEWKEGCTGCSFLADHVDGARQHFEHHDISFVAVSRGSLDKLLAYRKRMGWTFDWVSSAGSDFNFDFDVSFPEETRKDGVTYNFEHQPDPQVDELPGVSVFYKADDGSIYHTYSSFARGGEMLLTTYSFIDMTPIGRNEEGNLGDWVRRHDRYEDDGRAAKTNHSCCS